MPADHLLRSIDRFVDLSGIREELKPFYSETGRPSIDPVGSEGFAADASLIRPDANRQTGGLGKDGVPADADSRAAKLIPMPARPLPA